MYIEKFWRGFNLAMAKIFPKFCESEIRNFSRNKKELIYLFIFNLFNVG